MVYKTPVRHVAYLATPAFGAILARRAEPALEGKPLILLDDQGRVLAADAVATGAGVLAGQTESQAVARCPLAALRPATRYPIEEYHAALMGHVARYAGRWQPAGFGCAYLDTTGISGNLLSWCQSLADEVRRLDMVPTVGLAPSKFSATAAGQAAGRNSVLWLTPQIQRAFLDTQPTTLLPLDSEALLHLRHLGIRTLGQYACLPVAGVLTRFGEAGRTAQRWVQGYDERSVILPEELPEVSARIEFDAPVANCEILLAALMQRARQLLDALATRLQAVGKLALSVMRADGQLIPVTHVFSLPTAASQTICLAIKNALDSFPWKGEGAIEITLTLGGITDVPVHQLSLLDAVPTPRETLIALLDRLAVRFGPDAFRMAVLIDPTHPLPERRGIWKEFA